MSNKDFQNGFALGMASGGVVVTEDSKIKYCSGIAFTNAIFPENTELTLELPNITSFNGLFMGAKNLVRVKISGNIGNSYIPFINLFNRCNSVKVIDFSDYSLKPSSMQNAFNECGSLVEISGEFDFTNTTNFANAFVYCSALEELRIKPNTLSLSLYLAQSARLSAETVQSIVDGLATVATAQTLTLNKAIVLTDEQKATINSKGWTLAQ